MTGKEFAAKCKAVATNYTTCYVWGTFGWPCKEDLIQRNVKQYPNNAYKYAAKARSLIGDGWMFDCVGLIKAILWGWTGKRSHNYGGATYASNKVPDVSADGMIAKCKDVSGDFSTIEVGEVVWLSGHIGVYIGDGLAVECTPAFKGGVQITAVKNLGEKAGYSARRWTKHGKLPYVTYTSKSTPAAPTPKPAMTIKVDPAKEYNKSYAKTYTVTANSGLNIRRGASTTKGVIKALPKGSKVTCYGYYTQNGATIWLYVKAADGTIGFCSKKYLQ